MRRPAVIVLVLGFAAGACSTTESSPTTSLSTTTIATTSTTSTTTTPPTTTSTTAPAPGTLDQLEAMFAAHGGPGAFGDLGVLAVTNLLLAEDSLRDGDADSAAALLDEVWAVAAPGSDRWWDTPYIVNGAHVGAPAGYYGLRMLDDVVAHLQESPVIEPHRIDLVIVLVGCSTGIRARTEQDLVDGTGEEVELVLDPDLNANADEWFDQATWAFRQHVEAMTEGRLALDLRIVRLPDVCVPIQTRQFDVRVASVTDYTAVWEALDPELVDDGAWLWVLNPSAVPASPEIGDLEYITGGMGLHPNGAPAFLSDDLWVVRKPPHLGEGPWSDVERRAYMPQWLMHEFFHHLYREYPEFGLEEVGHQWFDLSTWPDDFEGRFEPDYFAESLHKRLQGAEPALHLGLRYDAPSPGSFADLTVDDLVGTYRRLPVENGYHTGIIGGSGRDFTWTNEAGVSWSLTWDPISGLLVVGPDGVYNDVAGGEAFTILLRRDASGGFGEVEGFRFLGEIYVRE